MVKSHSERSMSAFESPNPNLQYFQYQQYIFLWLSHVPKGSQRFYYVAHVYSILHMPTPTSKEILGEGGEYVTFSSPLSTQYKSIPNQFLHLEISLDSLKLIVFDCTPQKIPLLVYQHPSSSDFTV